MTGALPLPGWYDDSKDPAMLRWWDGAAWTDHTRDNPSEAGGQAEQVPASRIGSGPLYEATEVVAVEQAPSGNAASYQLLDAAGRALGSIHQTDADGQVGVPMPPGSEQDVKYYSLYDAAGTALLHIVQPHKSGGDIFRPKFGVTDSSGRPVGEIKAATSGMGRNRMSYLVGGSPAGRFAATSWLSSTHRVDDAWKRQVAEIVKREFTVYPLPHIPANGDSYLLSRPKPIPEPLGSLVLLSLLTLDVAYHDNTK